MGRGTGRGAGIGWAPGRGGGGARGGRGDPAPAGWAAAQPRPQGWTPSREPCPLDRWPDSELMSIVCTDDELVTPDWSRRIAREVLGVEPVELPGGHFPMLGVPTELAEALDG